MADDEIIILTSDEEDEDDIEQSEEEEETTDPECDNMDDEAFPDELDAMLDPSYRDVPEEGAVLPVPSSYEGSEEEELALVYEDNGWEELPPHPFYAEPHPSSALVQMPETSSDGDGGEDSGDNGRDDNSDSLSNCGDSDHGDSGEGCEDLQLAVANERIHKVFKKVHVYKA